MKKYIVLFSMLMLLFVAACGKSEAPAETIEKSIEEAPVTEPVEPPAMPQETAEESEDTMEKSEATQIAPEETEEEPIAAEEMSPAVAALLKKADEKVKSYSYLRSQPPNNDMEDEFFIKGSKMKIGLYEINEYMPEIDFDTVYLDTDAKTAIAYCEGEDIRCPDKNKEFEVEYDQFIEKTPYQWIKEVTYAKSIGSEMIDKRDTDVIEYTNKEGAVVRLKVDKFSGIPLRVLVIQNGKTLLYEFKDIDINTLKDEDLVHQPAK